MTARHRLAVALVILAMIASLLAAEWQEADTAHFRFLFEPRDRPYVDQFLTFCEDVYAQVTGLLGSYPKTVPCVIRGRDTGGARRLFPGSAFRSRSLTTSSGWG